MEVLENPDILCGPLGSCKHGMIMIWSIVNMDGEVREYQMLTFLPYYRHLIASIIFSMRVNVLEVYK